jgi:hypothetical protein
MRRSSGEPARTAVRVPCRPRWATRSCQPRCRRTRARSTGVAHRLKDPAPLEPGEVHVAHRAVVEGQPRAIFTEYLDGTDVDERLHAIDARRAGRLIQAGRCCERGPSWRRAPRDGGRPTRRRATAPDPGASRRSRCRRNRCLRARVAGMEVRDGMDALVEVHEDRDAVVRGPAETVRATVADRPVVLSLDPETDPGRPTRRRSCSQRCCAYPHTRMSPVPVLGRDRVGFGVLRPLGVVQGARFP